MDCGEFLVIGVVTRTHGVHGKIRVNLQGEDEEAFLALREVRIGKEPGSLDPLKVLSIRPHKGRYIMEIEGFDYQRARDSVGLLVWVRRDQLPPLKEGEYYWQDLMGMEVVDEGGKVIGRVEAILNTGSNEVLECRKGSKEVLIPFIEDVVIKVDMEQRRIHIRVVEGLF
jgi:16S rRNA processing protein RimM